VPLGECPKPKDLAKEASARLRAMADPESARGFRTFFKQDDEVTLLGVKTAPVRTLARELYKRVAAGWQVDDAVAFADLMARNHYLEAKFLGLTVLGRYRHSYPRSLLAQARKWLAEGHLSNWAAVDALAPLVLTPLLVRHPRLEPRLLGWARARSQWLRRAAVVTLVPLARRGERLDQAYALVASLFPDGEDLMHKACGWLLREAGKTDMPRLERFLLRHGPAIPRTTVRYAIERFAPRRRKRLLVQTRG
jgi:3-methyladenine DNA glycosylase AlkD